MKITPQTTLAELEIERARLGVTSLLSTLKTEPDGVTLRVGVMLISDDGIVYANGPSVDEAIATAFDRRTQQINNHFREVRR